MSEQLTQEELTQLLEAEKAKYADLESQLNTLKSTYEQKELEVTELNNKLFSQKVENTLREKNLLQFKDIVKPSNEDELNDLVNKLSQAVSSSNADFVPAKRNKQNTSYDHKGDTISMLKSIFKV